MAISAHIADREHKKFKDVSSNPAVRVALDEAISSAIDSIDVAKMSKGTVTLAHNAVTVTTTSAEINCTGFNALIVHVDVSGAAWTAKVQGSTVTGGTFADCYYVDQTATVMTTPSLSADACFCFRGIPDYVKIVATEDSGTANCTVRVQPVNL